MSCDRRLDGIRSIIAALHLSRSHDLLKEIAMLRLSAPTLGLLAALLAPGLALAATMPQRAQLTGEVIDTWCYLSEIMYAEGTAHHQRSEEHTSELQSLMRISYAV